MKEKGRGRIFQRGETYWMAYYFGGREFRESTKQTDPKLAQVCLSARLDERGAARTGAAPFTTPQAKRVTIADLCEGLRKQYARNEQLSASNKCVLARLEKDLGDFRALEFDAEQFDEYIDQRLEAETAPATINRVGTMLKQCYRYGVQKKLFAQFNVPNITHLEEDNTRDDIFTEGEVARVIENLPEDLRDLTAWCAFTGMRSGEAKLLRWDWIHAEVLNIPRSTKTKNKRRKRVTKNKKPRAIPLDTPELAEIISRRRKLRPVEVDGAAELSPFIFHRTGEVGAIRSFQKSWRGACIAAGCPTRLFHSLRRFAVTNLINTGVPIPVAKLWSGHDSDTMFERYGIINTDTMKAEMARVTEYRAKAAAKEAAAAKKLVAIR
jgi:integrase